MVVFWTETAWPPNALEPAASAAAAAFSCWGSLPITTSSIDSGSRGLGMRASPAPAARIGGMPGSASPGSRNTTALPIGIWPTTGVKVAPR